MKLSLTILFQLTPLLLAADRWLGAAASKSLAKMVKL